MTLHVEVIDDPATMGQLSESWDDLVMKSAGAILGHDATSGYVWFESLLAAFPAVRGAKLVVVRDGEAVVALLPVAPAGRRSLWLRLFVPTVLYGGRNGFLLNQPDEELLAALLAGICKAFGRWQSIRLTVVAHSDSERLLTSVCAKNGFKVVNESAGQSPYFPLLDDPNTFNAKMSKGLKQTLRTAINKFRVIGPLEFREIVDESGAAAAIDAVLTIDRRSWKHDAGSAITRQPDQERFYRAFFPRALGAGLLYGQILHLSDKPIAFNFGLLHAGVYSCLKHSQTIEYQSLSPSQLLNAAMIAKLRAKGARLYDFMGKPEPHKLKWSDATGNYECRQVWIYSPTYYGRIGFGMHVLKRAFKWRLWALQKPSAQGVRPRT